ncbi:MAG: AmmeMemoRadiSam system protein B [Armatimonadetes bacterium]|nr:AmmeMemoRadiSam system protein B [Armatimonadota bacterium]
MTRALPRAIAALVGLGLSGALVSCARDNPKAGASVAQVAGEPAAPQEGKTMRATAVAGAFYPGDPTGLKAQIDGFLAKAELPKLEGRIVAVMVPHAGYVYSAPVAAYGYKALQGKPITTVVIIGNSHRTYFSGAALSPDDAWNTPLGPVEVDQAINQELVAANSVFTSSRSAHADEHSLEVQVPFIKTVLPDAKIVPILLADVSDQDLTKVADALAPVLQRPEVVLVASSDMAHYPVYDAAKRSDTAMLDAIVTLDPQRVLKRDRELMGERTPELHCTLCGLDAVITTIMAAKKAGVTEAKTLKYMNSGDTAGDKGRCVGYGAVAFLAPQGAQQATAQASGEELPLTETEKRRLLKVARQTLEANFGLADKPSLDPGDSKLLAQKTACFVTLKLKGRLRGCIGELEPRQPLIQAVASRATAAAEQDPRFMPLTADELQSIAIEISAMSPLRKVAGADEIVVGKHGVVVKQDFRSGVFLPQVAPEQGWDRDTMLSILCTEKAGLPPDAWKHGAELWVFTANVFSEEEFGMAPPDSLKGR